MKKIKQIIYLALTATTFYYSYLLYTQLYNNQFDKYSNLQTNFLSCQQLISNFLKSLESEAINLKSVTDPEIVKNALSPNLMTVALFDAQKKFVYGWSHDFDEHEKPHPISSFTMPDMRTDEGWVNLILDSKLFTCRGYYIIKREDNSFLVLTFSLVPAIDSLGSLSFGFDSSSYVDYIPNNESPPSVIFSIPNLFSRIFNQSIFLKTTLIPDWALVFSGNWTDLYPYTISDIHLIFYTLLLWGILITLTTAILSKISPSNASSLWITSLVFDFFCLLLIIFFFLDLPAHYEQTTERTLSFKKAEDIPKASAILVPTAIYIESLSFPNDSSFLISGFVSQIYPKNENLTYGFIFPNESVLYTSDITEVSRWETSYSVTILWHFSTGLTSSFSPVFYPFDKRNVPINIWPKETHQDIVFFPNFLNYKKLNAQDIYSIDPNVNPIEWEILRSTYLIEPKEAYNFFGFTHLPISFKFAIILQRDFLGAFLSNILVLTLCMVVAFLILFIPYDSLLNSVFATISIFVGLIFVAVTNHASLRNSLAATSFAYIEYLFISFYALILAMTIDFIFRIGKKETVYNNSLIRRVCYWPLILGSFTSILATTII
ncbi:MAG: hypothetical protein FJZ59_04210 [Chlamydiae bacterium]|nr:hypothetical protein [Chlamydiota bacterium]